MCGTGATTTCGSIGELCDRNPEPVNVRYHKTRLQGVGVPFGAPIFIGHHPLALRGNRYSSQVIRDKKKLSMGARWSIGIRPCPLLATSASQSIDAH